ncbi:cellulase family glycosylhydrolase [Stutzerimonas nitrititolerans]|uniref:cellulase family glycosylhydrolase n=1 Tax=Stutzerimonas nitrititolerans TaxID=2482751 RepID=UPI0028A77033|nr:cellulase family glycosylhydrolase [Stutzerimonas nitrititolerans]
MSFRRSTGKPRLLVASVALATMFGVTTVYNQAVAAEPATASATVAFTSPINRFNSKDFVNGVWKNVPAFSVPATTASIAAFKRGVRVRFADGQVRKITQVNRVGDNLSVYVDGALLDGSKVGAPNTVSVLGDAPATSAGGTPKGGSAPTDSGYAASINNFTNTDWLNGVWRKSAGVSIPATEANKEAFKVGAKAKTADGVTRTVTRVTASGANLSVFMDGAPIDGNVAGYPRKLALAASSASEPGSAAPVATTPLNNFTNADWLNGIWRKSAGFSIPATAANQAAFKAGASARLADGQVRKITRSQVVGNNMSVFLEGAAIDGNALGYPKTISVVSASAGPGATTEARPAQAPSTGVQAPVAGGDSGIRLVGVNLSAAGFGPQVVPGTYGKHYFYPDESYYKKYADNGLDLVRLPFLWERIQPKLNTNLDSAELARLLQSLDLAQKHGVKVILDMHNYYRYYGKLIGTKEVPIESFASVWKQIVQKVVNHPAVLGYGLMNEPYVTNGLWPQAAEAAAKAIRTLDRERWIYVAGDRYSSAFHWPKYNPTLVNSPWMRDPKNNLVYEAHMYLDKDYSGNYADRSETYAPDLGVERVKPFVDWLKANNLRGYIGEHGVPDYAPSAMVAMDNLLTYLRQNCVPMTYWAAGPWWGEYVLSLDTKSNSHRPQLTVLKKHAAATNNCTSIGPLR